MNFKKWVKSVQTAGYNVARTVYKKNVNKNIVASNSKSVLKCID